MITSHIEKTLGHYTSTVTLGNNTKDSEIAFALQLQAKVFFHFFKEENAKKCKPPTAYNPEDPEHGVQIKIDEQAFGGRAHQFKDLCFNAGFVKVFIGTQVHINPRFATAHPAEMRADVTNVSVPLAADENVSTTGFANPAFGLLNSSDSAWQQNPLYEGPGLGAGAENLYSEASMSRRPLPAATSQASNHAPGFFSGGWRNYFPGGKKPKLTSNPTYQPVPTNNSRPEFTGASQENPVYSPSHTYEEILEGPVKGQQLPAEPVYTRANGPEVFDDAASSLGGTTPPPPPEEIIPEDQDAHQATI